MKTKSFLGSTMALVALAGLLMTAGFIAPDDSQSASWIKNQFNISAGITGLLALLSPIQPSNTSIQKRDLP